ncbi:hypothetical protein BDQ12DRAFT_673573 [Crucibulum laeve]|uniref:Uncharacterized protein n=1 Tax=Crucibulum laeve TaxID=68775 RepID=A0A5C3MTR4_9AGAR|nr:hypothetical protein BDQ12DRAFT_673573 [Crucibulum laeve]
MATLRPSSPSTYHLQRSMGSHPSTSTAPMGRKSSVSTLNAHHSVRDMPWQHMTQTYTWVVEQEIQKQDRRTGKAEQWVLEQQIFLTTESNVGPLSGHGERVHRRVWDEMAYVYEVEADQWMKQQERARRMAAEREKAKTRIVQEELRRVEARIRQKREDEKRRFVEERTRMYTSMRERERRERERADKATADAWERYEARWVDLLTSTETATFSTIPWPTVTPPKTVEDITSSAIESFLFSPLHSSGLSRKDRIRSAQLRWHPDRFQRVLRRVKEEDRGTVEEGVGIIARCLNDSMSREKTSRRVRGFRF